MKSVISDIHTNYLGKTINKKIVVIESDDWGSIRIPSKNAIKNLQSSNIFLKNNPYTNFDGLETDQDVELLLDLLSSFKDSKGNNPKITANFVSCNPDFVEIRKSKFDHYVNEKISQTYSRINNSNNVLKLFNSGFKESLILPQFHGREHVNVEYWMSLLKMNNEIFMKAFDVGISGLPIDTIPIKISKNLQATYDTLNSDFAKKSLIEGLDIFEQIFRFKSKSFIPNNFTLSPEHFDVLSQYGVEVLQGMKYLLLPKTSDKKREKTRRFNGLKNQFNQINIVRNCVFEPTETRSDIDSTISSIAIAFRMKQPAIISTHRINYTSRISIKNRDENLIKFKQLINSILKKWPDVEFFTTLELAYLYKFNNN